ncbi:MAG: hypothetical protein DWQ36_05250 [Acidobacteria bacterium]|nr:MAG: hypothetical protein DWQ30_10270 [Acidobacteriota bacterium]REK10183.1 MAG: hypothetical protein DWQ36_05250 [Acidobacteriota bacterium]
MNPQRRQQILLAALVLVLVTFGGARLREWIASVGSGEAFGFRSRKPDVSAVLQAEVAELESAAASHLVAEFTPGRDPWSYGRPPAPERPPPPVVQRPEPKPIQMEPVAPPVERTGKPVPPPIDVEYLGSFGPKDRKIAVFADGETTINALRGEVVKKKFRVHAIGFESVDLTFEGFPDAPPKRLALKGSGR